MLPGDAGIVQIDVRRLAPAQDVLPVGQGQGRAVWQAQLAPVLRRVGESAAESGPPGTGSARPEPETESAQRPYTTPPASGCAASRAVRLSSSPCRISMGPPPLLKHNCIVCYYSIFSGKCTALPSPASFHWGGAAGGICAGFPEVSAFFRSFSRGISLLLLTSVEKSFKI